MFSPGWRSIPSRRLSDPSESHSVSLFVESSSVIGSGVVLGLRSFLNRFMQRRVGCSLPHSSHRSGDPMSSLIRLVYVRVGCSLFCLVRRFRALASAFIDGLGCGAFAACFRASTSTFREWSGEGFELVIQLRSWHVSLGLEQAFFLTWWGEGRSLYSAGSCKCLISVGAGLLLSRLVVVFTFFKAATSIWVALV